MNKFKKIILNNGIPLYLYIDPSMKKTFVSYNLKYGSSGEWFDFKNNGKDYSVITGYAHYLEHLLGEHSKFGNMYRNFDKRFQNANAYTGMNVTSYHFNGINNIEKSLEELIISIDSPVFNQSDVDTTRHAIEEEAASYLDNTRYMLSGLLDRNLYGGFELIDKTLSPIGNRYTTKEITIDGLYDCYNAFYTDDRKFIVIGGNVDEKEIVDLLNNIYSKITPHESSLELKEIDYDSMRSKDEIIHGDLDVSKIGLGIKIKKPSSVSMRELYYVLYLIRNSMLDSPEFKELEKKGVYDSLDFSYLRVVKDYINFCNGCVSKEKDNLVNGLYDIITKRNITKKEYELAKKSVIATELRYMEYKYDHLEGIPNDFNYTENFSEYEFYQTIDYDRFMEIYSSLNFDNYTVGEVKRLKKINN